MGEKQDLPKPPEPLASPIRLLVALGGLCATLHPAHPVKAEKWFSQASHAWLEAVLKLLEIKSGQLPPQIEPDSVRASAQDQNDDWTPEEKTRIAGVLVEASLAVEANAAKAKKEEALRYTPIAKALSHRTLWLLGLDAGRLLAEAEKNLSHTLFNALKASEEEKHKSEEVEKVRQARSQGWGGSLGRHLATGAGVIAGGVLIGVTGGLAAPAIAAVLAPLGIGGLIGGAAAPVVLGTLFGVGGGGLAGRRVRERWKGVEEFSFVEVGDGTRATREEIEDLNEARQKAEMRKARVKEGQPGSPMAALHAPQAAEKSGEDKSAAAETAATDAKIDDASAAKAVEEGRGDLEDQLLKLSLEAGTRGSVSDPMRTSTDSVRPSLDHAAEEKELAEAKKPPSLTATIVVPGLLTVSRTEAITAWRAICSARAARATFAVREKHTGDASATDDQALELNGLKDGRDVYLLRFESATMLKTGRDIDFWIESKLKAKIKSEIIKRTILNAYFAAVSLPLTAYSMATMSLDNTWMQAVDRAKKAGKLLGEVLEKRVQGERPVVLIGSSLGALTIQYALLHLASLPPPTGSSSSAPLAVESAFLISLPSAPTEEEWAKCRSVVARRLVNAWTESDLVLAGVVRLHEVLSRAATLSNGVKVAGLGLVGKPGVEDVDVSQVVRGHMELQAKMADILRVIDVDR